MANKKIKFGSQERIKQFQDQLDVAKKNHEDYKSKWENYDRAYHGDIELPQTSQDLLRSKLQVPWIWQQIETISPRIMDPEPKFDFNPVEFRDVPLTETLNTLVNQQLTADRFLIKQKSWIEDGMVKGLGVAKVVWLQEKKCIKERSITPFGVRLPPRMKEHIVTNRPSVIYVDPYDFFWDPSATNDQNWRYVFQRSWLSVDELKERERKGVYKNTKDIRASNEDDSSVRGTKETPDEAMERRGDKIAIYERFSNDGTVMTMCEDVVLRDDYSPYYHMDIPYAIFRTQPTPRSLVGVSEVEKIEHLQLAVWTRDNQRIDALSLALNQILIVDPLIQGIKSLTIGPKTKIYANQAQRVEQLRFDANQVPAFEETEAYIGAMQQMTGASPMFSMSDPSQYGIDNSTATGASIMQEEANKRMAMKKLEFRIFEARIAKLMVQLNHQYLSDFELQRIVGQGADPTSIRISPSDIPMFLDVIPTGMNESMSKSVERNEIIELLNLLGPQHMTPMPDGTTFTIKPYLQRALKSYDQNPDEPFIPNQMVNMPMMPGMEPQGPGIMGSNGVPSMENQINDMGAVQ